MVIVKTIDIQAKENQIGIFDKQVNTYLLEGYDLIVKTDTYAKLIFKSTFN